MKNRLSDLNDHLFAQMERLSEEGLTAEQIATESDRTDAIVAVSTQIISNGRRHRRPHSVHYRQRPVKRSWPTSTALGSN